MVPKSGARGLKQKEPGAAQEHSSEEGSNTSIIIKECTQRSLHLDMGKEDGTPERGLSNMDRESTRKIGVKMGTALPKGP